MKERRKILAEDEVMKDLADQQKAILKKEKKNQTLFSREMLSEIASLISAKTLEYEATRVQRELKERSNQHKGMSSSDSDSGGKKKKKSKKSKPRHSSIVK